MYSNELTITAGDSMAPPTATLPSQQQQGTAISSSSLSSNDTTINAASSVNSSPMANHGHENNSVTVNNHRNNALNVIETQPKRRVSIIVDQGHDNPAFEPIQRRKISQTSVNSHSEIGPTRRKSILTNSAGHDNESDHGSIYSYADNNRGYKPSALDAFNAKISQNQQQRVVPTKFSSDSNNVEESWIYTFCMKCRGGEKAPSWEPPFWQKLCPYPLCPSFRALSRLISIIAIGILLWLSVYMILGDSAAPGGQLFNLVVLTVAANFGGWIISLTTLPRLIGMLLVGILFQNVGWVHLDGDFARVTGHLRKFALTIILIRAGLEMDPEAFKKVYKTILKLGLVPWILEVIIDAVLVHFLLNLPWIWAFLLGSIIAAVSPAVVVPCLFRLRTKGYGVTKGIPTLIVAVAGIDDAMSVALFGIISSILFTDKGLAYQISQAPVCIIAGLGLGYIWGNIARIFPEKGDAYVVPMRTILLFSVGLASIYGSEHLGYEGVGPLAVVFAAFVSNVYWCKQGWTIDDSPVSTAFEIFWMIFEPILFGVTGATVKISELDPDIVGVGLGVIAAGAILRIFCTAGIAVGDGLNTKEKFFVAISWMSKATVQAALGPVAMKNLKEDATDDEKHYAYIIQTLCVLSIVLTAPLGAILISITGKKLLTKTTQPQNLEGWRRSHRPSIRDISIIDEEEEREDPEEAVNHRKKSYNLDQTQTNRL